jgi:hypothetical protein
MIIEEEDFHLLDNPIYIEAERLALKEKMARLEKEKIREILMLQESLLLEYGGES